jgi:sodium-dependent phosphate cotransporter
LKRRIRRFLYALLGIVLFILALRLLQKGAGSLAPLLHSLTVGSVWSALGLGWLMAYLILSGSPVAAVALTLFGGQVLSDIETFGMITGSRLGASFVVLFVGFVYYLRGQRRIASVSIGVLTFLVTATIYLPAMALGYAVLTSGMLDGVRLGALGPLHSLLDGVFGPIVLALTGNLPRGVVFLLGMGVLLCSFRIFDRALPQVERGSSRVSGIADFVYRPAVMFLAGMAVTAVTLSVSVSLTILVPLSAKGYVRRENIIPYIMGANITTFVDTLAASLLINEPRAFVIVLTEILCVSFFSLLTILFFYGRYQRLVEWLTERITRRTRYLVLFLIGALVVPIALLRLA